MNRIRFLKFYFAKGSSCGEYLSEGLTQFRKELRYLQWEGYPCKSLPLGLCVEFLVDIHRCHGNVEELWQGKRYMYLYIYLLSEINQNFIKRFSAVMFPFNLLQDLNNLEMIDLSECRKLMNLPDMSNASRL
ncbi:hypothetical protein S83_065319 [Arachis hypogaea]